MWWGAEQSLSMPVILKYINIFLMERRINKVKTVNDIMQYVFTKMLFTDKFLTLSKFLLKSTDRKPSDLKDISFYFVQT